MDSVTLTGKTVLITGANTGIGKETARELSRRGARVILGCRNAERGEAARREIEESTNNRDVIVRILDLGSLKAIKNFAEEFNQNESRLDILVNNAGLMSPKRQETTDKFEMHFGTNHLGHFYLTYLLLDKLKSSAPSRVVVVSSMGHAYGKPDLDDLQITRGSYSMMNAYGRSKTANILFATHLAKLLAGTGVTVYSLHPGCIQTDIARDFQNSWTMRLWGLYFRFFGEKILTVKEGAETTLYCCLEPSIAQHSGRYYSESREKTPKSYATDPDAAEKLWKISADLCHISP
jgi:NAD(P)-dependent dehydrogenase (short-subunit alcohol dehydrogenase family)